MPSKKCHDLHVLLENPPKMVTRVLSEENSIYETLALHSGVILDQKQREPKGTWLSMMMLGALEYASKKMQFFDNPH